MSQIERIIQCNQLLVQADQVVSESRRVASADTSATQRQQFADTYQGWYALGQRVILDDLRDYFETRYTTAIGGMPSIRDLLTILTRESVQAQHHLGFQWLAFQLSLEEQCEALRMTRRTLMPRLAQIPYDLRLVIATICKRVYHEPSIDRLFIDNGCLLTWWMPPLKPLLSTRMTRAMGWLDGIVLVAPDQEVPIVRAICQDIARKPRLAQNVREELTGILDQLTAMPAPLVPVVSTNTATLRFLMMTVDAAQSADEKGKTLETLMEQLFMAIPGFSVLESRVKTATEEIDLVITNNSDDPRFRREGALIVVECKNWSTMCGKNELVIFQAKVENRKERCSLGFFVSWNGFTTTFEREQIRGSHERTLVVPLTGADIREAIANDTITALLIDAWNKAVLL